MTKLNLPFNPGSPPRWRSFYGLVVFVVIQPFLKLFLSPNRAYVFLIDFRQKKVLLQKNVIGPRRWSLPGGGLSRRETHLEAACREVAEELNFSLNPSKLKQVYEVSKQHLIRQGSFVYFIYPLTEQDLNYNQAEVLSITWRPLTIYKDLHQPLRKILRKIIVDCEYLPKLAKPQNLR